MTPCTSWTTYLSALLTPTIALAVGYVAYRQWRTAQNKLKLDLFDRRLAMFDAAITLIFESQAPSGASEKALSEYFRSTQQAKWLFNDQIDKYFRMNLYAMAITIKSLSAELEGIEDGGKRIEKTSEIFKAHKEMMNQCEVLDKKLTPFLKLLH
jgi:hypothetical protein